MSFGSSQGTFRLENGRRQNSSQGLGVGMIRSSSAAIASICLSAPYVAPRHFVSLNFRVSASPEGKHHFGGQVHSLVPNEDVCQADGGGGTANAFERVQIMSGPCSRFS